MANPSSSFEEIKGFFHSLSKVNTGQPNYANPQLVFNSTVKSAHNISASDVRTDQIAYCPDAASANAWITANPLKGKAYVQFPLTPVAGSNNQAWYLNDSGTWIKSWLSPVDQYDPTNSLPSDGFQANIHYGTGAQAGQQIPLTAGIFVVDYFAGMVLFDVGYDPVTQGWCSLASPITISNYVYIGSTLQSSATGATDDDWLISWVGL